MSTPRTPHAPPPRALSGQHAALAPAPQASGVSALLGPLWRDQRIGFAVGLGLAVLAGLLVAFTLPRGPVTTVQALALLPVCLVIGGLVGLVTRSRWAILLAPVAHAIAFEIGRLGADGPTVDGLRPGTAYGILAFALGRVVYALVGLLPLALGAVYGAALARHLRDAAVPSAHVGARVWRYARRGVTGLVTVGLVALAAGFVLPAHTPALRGPDDHALPGGIAELTTVRLGGHDQAIMIHAATADKPVLLYLSGGPGQSDLPFSRVLFDDLARDFVVVGWDQRGTGKSYAALDPATLTLERAVSDTIELTDYLRARFDEPKIYLLGESYGTLLGVLAAQRRPDLYHAFIGSGQMVSVRETDRRLYRDVLDLAARTGDTALDTQMRAYGEPPYGDFFASSIVFQQYDRLYRPYTPPAAYAARGTASGIGPWGVFAPEYTLIEKIGVLRGLMDTFAVMYPQLQGIDFRRDVPRLAVPVYILDGAGELTARRDLTLEWYAQLDAPQKHLFTFTDAGHSVAFEEFAAFHRIMVETVLPETYPGR